MPGCHVTTEYARRGIDVVLLENEALRVEVLAGKGGDVTEIRDKRTDVNVLFESPHEWRAPGEGYSHPTDPASTFMDYYPGGWQDVLPAAGSPSRSSGATLGQHGEASLVPWEVTDVVDDSDRVAVTIACTLTRYPFHVERTLSLEADEGTLRVDERVTNEAPQSLPYSWLQHVALGEPLVGPEARLDVPCTTVLSDPDHDPDTARFPTGERYEWPVAELDDGTRIDLREFPPRDAAVHDLVALTDLEEGRYTLANPDLDLGVTVRFPEEHFEYLWYWQPLGGFTESPYFGRNYNVGLEPCTSIPNAGLDRAIENGTAAVLDGGDTLSASFEFETHRA